MKKKNLIIILIISGVLILIVGGYFIWQVVKQKKQESKTAEQKEELKIAWDKDAETLDSFSDPGGPYYHKIYKATSQDGITFTPGDLVFEKSSVPDVVRMSDGKIFYYAVDGARRSKSGIMVALSEDEGKTWKAGSMQLKIKGKSYEGVDPEIVLLPDGRLRLYYVVFSNEKPPLDQNNQPLPTSKKIVNKIKSAVSEDGVNFTEEEGSRLEYSESLTDPDVIKIGNKWFMYLSKGRENIAYTSDDGLSFVLVQSIRQDGSVSKTVDVGDGNFRQFFCKNGISSAVTSDGLNFINEVVSLKNYNAGIICDPSPIKLGDGSWLMIYKIADKPSNSNPGGQQMLPPGNNSAKPPL